MECVYSIASEIVAIAKLMDIYLLGSGWGRCCLGLCCVRIGCYARSACVIANLRMGPNLDTAGGRRLTLRWIDAVLIERWKLSDKGIPGCDLLANKISIGLRERGAGWSWLQLEGVVTAGRISSSRVWRWNSPCPDTTTFPDFPTLSSAGKRAQGVGVVSKCWVEDINFNHTRSQHEYTW